MHFVNLSGAGAIVGGSRRKRYIAISHTPLVTLVEIWVRGPKCPRKADSGREVTNVEKAALLGGHPKWAALSWVSVNGSVRIVSISPCIVMGSLHLRMLGFVRAWGNRGRIPNGMPLSNTRTDRRGARIADRKGFPAGSTYPENTDRDGAIGQPQPSVGNPQCKEPPLPIQSCVRNWEIGRLDARRAEGDRGAYISAWQYWFQFKTNIPDLRWIIEVIPKCDAQLINCAL